MSSVTKAYRWMLVDDHITNFNDWRATIFKPGTMIVVDESIFRWYGHGGEWINWGLRHYVDIDRKPDSGFFSVLVSSSGCDCEWRPSRKQRQRLWYAIKLAVPSWFLFCLS